jgi:hypothetical protein
MLFFGLEKIDHSLTSPGMIIGDVIVLYLALLVTSSSIDDLKMGDLLLGEFPYEATWLKWFTN